VWQETDAGSFENAGPQWARKSFDGEEGLRTDRLYFLMTDWEKILIALTSEKSRIYLAIPQASKLLSDDIAASSAQFPKFEGRAYDWPVWRAIEHVRAVIEDDDEHACYLRTQIALRQAALDRRITIFGRGEIPPPKPAGYPSEIWTRIKPEYWENHKLTSLATSEGYSSHDHTIPDPYSPYAFGERYWSLTCNREEIEKAWPPEWTKWIKLFGHWNLAAERDFSKLRDLANSKACLAGATAGTAHIRMLMDAALQPVLEILGKARNLNAPESLYASFCAEGISCLELFQRQAADVVLNPSGRCRAGAAEQTYLESLIREGKARIENLVAQWSAEDACVRSSTMIEANRTSVGNVNDFDAPQPRWLELWQGPLRFRATYERGQFGPGHSFEDINKHGLGRSKNRDIYTVRGDPGDGAIVIEWHVGLPGRKRSESRYYDGHPKRELSNQLKDDRAFRKRYFGHLPAELRERAVGAYATAVTIREWLEQEFFNAVYEGQCEIWARIGSRVAPFSRISADVFRAHKVKCWGYGNPGAAWAELKGESSLFAIHVAPSAGGLPIVRATKNSMLAARPSRAPAVKAGHPPTDDIILKKADEMKARGLTGYEIASKMRHEPGFADVATIYVRDLIKGRWKGGRPRGNGAP
jgi:hypothetical protein